MSLSIGIVGLPNVGKSTLFQTLTKKRVERSNYPFCTIDPNVGVVKVPDKRVNELAELENSAKEIYAIVEFIDIAGLIKGASKGEGLGSQFLANIREVDAIIYILRFFENPDIINTQNKIDPLSEKKILDLELILKDLETVDKRIIGLEKDLKRGDKNTQKEFNLLRKVKEYLEQEKVLSQQEWDDEELKILKNYQFLTSKPCLYLFNGKIDNKQEEFKQIAQIFEENKWPFLIMDILNEFEAASFSSEERETFGLSDKSQLDILIQTAYQMLDLITFFTTGEDETRAWTIKRGMTAPQAGGVIHTDFEKQFIKADVVSCKDLFSAGGFSQSREKGLLRTEGREYLVQDGDVIVIKSHA